MALRILGIDPGLITTGYAVVQAGPKLLEAGVIRPTTKGADLARRLSTLYGAVRELLDQWTPGAIVVEQLYAHYEHPRTAILMGHARGMFFLAGGERNIPVVSYPATTIKKTITGSGRASKVQMQHAIMREFGLAAPPEPHDVADAIAIALCHCCRSNAMRGPNAALHTGVNLNALLGENEDE
jgi:crossover junction endodeoxyribonuclease RuvC